MDLELLENLLRRKTEEDWFDFKRKLKLYQADGGANTNQRDELIKDILGMANGNSHIIRETKYLIIGAEDDKFDEGGMRILYDVDYLVPTRSDINKWVNSACDPAVTGIECETIEINKVSLYVIAIPPTFDLHETKRELITPRRFNEHTVFMRQDENTVPASVREGVAIQQLKHLHRQEVANPSAGWLGALIGGLVTLLLWGGESKIVQTDSSLSSSATRIVAVSVGAFFGAELGWLIQEFNKTRYTWRYWTNWERTGFMVFLFISGIITYFWFFR